MYAVPPKAATLGSTERIIGTWFARGRRDKVILATKVAGPDNPGYVRTATRTEQGANC